MQNEEGNTVLIFLPELGLTALKLLAEHVLTVRILFTVLIFLLELGLTALISFCSSPIQTNLECPADTASARAFHFQPLRILHATFVSP